MNNFDISTFSVSAGSEKHFEYINITGGFPSLLESPRSCDCIFIQNSPCSGDLYGLKMSKTI